VAVDCSNQGLAGRQTVCYCAHAYYFVWRLYGHFALLHFFTYRRRHGLIPRRRTRRRAPTYHHCLPPAAAFPTAYYAAPLRGDATRRSLFHLADLTASCSLHSSYALAPLDLGSPCYHTGDTGCMALACAARTRWVWAAKHCLLRTARVTCDAPLRAAQATRGTTLRHARLQHFLPQHAVTPAACGKRTLNATARTGISPLLAVLWCLKTFIFTRLQLSHWVCVRAYLPQAIHYLCNIQITTFACTLAAPPSFYTYLPLRRHFLPLTRA